MKCTNCGISIPIDGNESIGRIDCPKCGTVHFVDPSVSAKFAPEQNVPEQSVFEAGEAWSPEGTPPQITEPLSQTEQLPKEVIDDSVDFNDVVDFGNTDQPATLQGGLVFTLEIDGLDTTDVKKNFIDSLRDPRLHMDIEGLIRAVKNGHLTIPKINPVKASVIVNRVSHLPLKISWFSEQLVKGALVAAISAGLFFGIGAVGLSAHATSWPQHEVNINGYIIKIRHLEEDRDRLLKEKEATRDNARMDEILKELTKIYKEISKTYEEFEKEKEHIQFEHPEKGDAVERKYKRYRPKSVEEREAEAGLNGKLTHVKTRVQKTYNKEPDAVTEGGDSKENLEKDLIRPKRQKSEEVHSDKQNKTQGH